MRYRPAMRVMSLTVVGAALLLTGACSGDSDESAPEFTPAPTDVDPGPNDTSNAPQTVQGTLRLETITGCIALETETVRYALTFRDYELGEDAGEPVLQATSDARVLAHDGDTVILSGLPVPEPATDCGAPFTVDSFNSVLPPD